MAGTKLTAAERLAKLKAKQGKRGEEFAGGKKPTVSEPPQRPVEEQPSVIDKPPVQQPEQAEPEEENKTRGIDLDDSAVVEIQETPSTSAAPSTKLDPAPPVAEEPAVSEEPEASVEPEGPSPEPEEPSLPPVDELASPEALASGAGEPSIWEDDEPVEDFSLPPAQSPPAQSFDSIADEFQGNEDVTRSEAKRPSKPPVRTLLSAGTDDGLMAALKSPAPAPLVTAVEPAKAVPRGVKYHVDALDTGASTKLVVGVVANYVTAVGNVKVFTVAGPTEMKSVELAPGDEKVVELETSRGKAVITMQNNAGEITAYVEGGVTSMGAAAAKAGRAGKFLANVRYYLPELTMATLFTAATTAVLWTQQFVSDTLQNFHKPAVIAYGIIQLALTSWAVINQRKVRKAAEAQEAVKE